MLLAILAFWCLPCVFISMDSPPASATLRVMDLQLWHPHQTIHEFLIRPLTGWSPSTLWFPGPIPPFSLEGIPLCYKWKVNSPLWGHWAPLQFSSVTQSCPTLCDPMNSSMPGLPVHHQLLEKLEATSHQKMFVSEKKSNQLASF